MKQETKEITSAGSAGSFEAPMGFITKKEIYKIHNKKKYNEDDLEEGEFTEATTTATSAGAMYDAPFGDGSKNPLKIGGEKTIKSRMKNLKKKKFPMWGGPDGVYENDQLNEVVKEVSEKYGLPTKEVEKLVINEIKRIFI